MTHGEYIAFWRGRAESHYQIRHDAVDASTPGGRRISFFRMNNEQEMYQALGTQVDYPCLLLPPYRGRLQDMGGPVEDVMTGFFEIRMHVDEPLDFAQIEAARDACKRIAMEIVSWMAITSEEEGQCGPIGFFDPGTVQYDFTGPVNQNEYGVKILFQFSDTVFNYVTADLSEIFL